VSGAGCKKPVEVLQSESLERLGFAFRELRWRSRRHAGIAQLIGESGVDQGARYGHVTHAQGCGCLGGSAGEAGDFPSELRSKTLTIA
jgi:hypothetical protein